MQAMDARKLSPEGQADLRRRVVAAVEGGMSQQEAGRVFGISRRAVGVWVRAHRLNGPEALNPHRRGRVPGEQFALSRRQQAELLDDLSHHAPDELGLNSPVWSRRVLADFIATRFELQLSTTTVGHYLTRWGLVGGEGRARLPVAPRGGAATEAMRISWHRPTPRFIDSALVPGPGSVAAGPRPGQIGPPRDYLDVLVAQSPRGALYFLCVDEREALAAVRDFADRLGRMAGHPLTFTVGAWPADQAGTLRNWRTVSRREKSWAGGSPWAG